MNTQNFQQQFVTHASTFCDDTKLIEAIFSDLLSRYNEPHRAYHNLNHISMMLDDAHEFFRGSIPDALFFAIWFHDAIYDSTFGNNEERSTILAKEVLTKMNCDEGIILECIALIRKTADHFKAEAEDDVTRFFMDIDLKILGSEEGVYQEYLKAVRKEYSSLPSILFNMGRRKFLRKALNCERIFRTPFYFNKYEESARKNLLNELNLLS